MDRTRTASERSRISTIATIGAIVATVSAIGVITVGEMISMLVAPVALFGLAAALGLALAHAVERVRESRRGASLRPERRTRQRPLSRDGNCSICGSTRTRASAAWLCPTCDVGVAV